MPSTSSGIGHSSSSGPTARPIARPCSSAERPSITCYTRQIRTRTTRATCDGSYTRQRGRRTHCSLTEIGVRYWEYLPELFDWSADRNMDSCPLQGTYQLARNVLAACVQPDGTVDANSGHALVIYDDRNPAFLRRRSPNPCVELYSGYVGSPTHHIPFGQRLMPLAPLPVTCKSERSRAPRNVDVERSSA